MGGEGEEAGFGALYYSRAAKIYGSGELLRADAADGFAKSDSDSPVVAGNSGVDGRCDGDGEGGLFGRVGGGEVPHFALASAAFQRRGLRGVIPLRHLTCRFSFSSGDALNY